MVSDSSLFQLHLFSGSIGPSSAQSVLTTGFYSVATVTSRAVPSPLLVLAFSFRFPLQCLISTLTQGGKGGHLFRLTCSVVLWGGRDTANKHRWHVWGVLAVYGPHCICPSSRRRVRPGSTVLRLEGALQGHCPKRALSFVHFPGLSHSGSQVICKRTDSVGCAFCALPSSEQLR